MISLAITVWYIWASPDSVLGELSRGMSRLERFGSIAVQVADDGEDVYDDVLGPPGLYGLSFVHLHEVDRVNPCSFA